MHIKFTTKIRNKIPTDFLQVFLFDIVSKVFMIIITILLIRVMNLKEYEEIVKFTAISGFILGIFGQGIALSYIRYSTEQLSRGEKNSVGLHIVCTIFIIIISFVVLMFTPVFVGIYKTSTKLIIFASYYGIISSLINMNQAYFQSRELYIESGIINNLKNVFILFSLLFAITFFCDLKTELVFVLYIVSGMVTFMIGIIRIYKNVRFTDIHFDFRKYRFILKDSLYIVIYLLFINILNQVDVIMITNMMDEESVALYGIAFKYYSLLITLLPSIQSVMRVRTSKKEYIDDVNQRKFFILNWIKRAGVLVIPACALVILLSGIFMPIINGHKYDGSINAFRILVIGVAFSYMFASNISIMMAAKKYKTLCFIALVAVSINFLGNLIFIPIWGINAAAVSTLVSQATLNISATICIIVDKGGL